MSFHVQTKVIASRKRSLAQMALKRPVAGVLPVMTGKFVGPRELPAASFPVAVVRLLSRVSSQMRLEMRRLGVGLGAPGMRASVRRRPLPTPSAPSALLRRRDGSVQTAVERGHERVAGNAGDAGGAHGEEEIGELRGGGRRHEWVVVVG